MARDVIKRDGGADPLPGDWGPPEYIGGGKVIRAH